MKSSVVTELRCISVPSDQYVSGVVSGRHKRMTPVHTPRRSTQPCFFFLLKPYFLKCLCPPFLP